MDEDLPEDDASTDLFLCAVLRLEDPVPVQEAEEWDA